MQLVANVATVAFVAAVALSCSRKPSQGPPPSSDTVELPAPPRVSATNEPKTEPPKPDTAGEEPAPDDGADDSKACREIVARFSATLAAAPGKCKVDADCGVVPGGLDRAAMCGGVTDKKSADKLQAIKKEWFDAHCTYAWQCGAQMINPRCQLGECVRRLRWRRVGMRDTGAPCKAGRMMRPSPLS